MSSGQGIAGELSVGEVVSRTFDMYRQNFVKYFVLFVVFEAIIGVVDTWAYGAFVLPTLPSNPTPQQVFDWAPGFFGTLASLLAVVGLVTLVFYPMVYGSAVKMASDSISGGRADLGSSIRFVLSKLVLLWALGLVVGIIVFVGLVALIVPGIILGIMFSLVIPVLLIEGRGVTGSMSRSRELVGHRWLKTFIVFLVLGIIVVIAAAIVNAIGGAFGSGSVVVSGVLSAFYLPLLPIALTIYYYSNLARVMPQQAGQISAPSAVAQPGMKFCPSCGTQLVASATFCSKCGAKQPA